MTKVGCYALYCVGEFHVAWKDGMGCAVLGGGRRGASAGRGGVPVQEGEVMCSSLLGG